MKSDFLKFEACEAHGDSRFAGANTSRGFVSEYPKLYNEERAERVYIIKGSSGSGKSSKMRDIANYAEEKGLTCEYCYCGSDPRSLDAVVIKGEGRSVILLDGTAPHAVEAKYPAVRSEIIDFGRFLSEEKLKPYEKEIIACSAEKAKAYQRLYKCLKWTDLASAEIKNLIFDAYKEEKAIAAIGRIIGKTESGGSTERFAHGITMRGCAYYEPYGVSGYTKYVLRGGFDEKIIFMNTVKGFCRKHGAENMVCVSPLNTVDAFDVILPSRRVMFSAVEDSKACVESTVINMSRFFDKDTMARSRCGVRFLEKLRDSIFSEAMTELSVAARYHFRLEEIYGAAMNFDLLNEYIFGLRETVVSRLL